MRHKSLADFFLSHLNYHLPTNQSANKSKSKSRLLKTSQKILWHARPTLSQVLYMCWPSLMFMFIRNSPPFNRLKGTGGPACAWMAAFNGNPASLACDNIFNFQSTVEEYLLIPLQYYVKSSASSDRALCITSSQTLQAEPHTLSLPTVKKHVFYPLYQKPKFDYVLTYPLYRLETKERNTILTWQTRLPFKTTNSFLDF